MSAVAMQEASDLFEQYCTQRWNDGAIEYGPVAFVNNPVLTMLAEELFDIANYARMQFIKLAVLTAAVEEAGFGDLITPPPSDKEPQGPPIGADSFIKAGGEG